MKFPNTKSMYRSMAESHPSLVAGRVRCETCGRTLTVDSAACLQTGWPTCHGETMRLQPVTKEPS